MVTRVLQSTKARVLAAVGLLGVVGLLSLGPIARTRAIDLARARGVELEIGSASVGLFSVTLGDVRARLEGVAGLSVSLTTVHVDLSTSLALKSLRIEGGTTNYLGSAQALADDVAAWRERHTRKGDGTVSTVAYEAEKLSLKISDPPVELTELGLRREAGRTDVSFATARFHWHDGDFVANRGHATLQAARIESAELAVLEFQEAPDAPATTAASANHVSQPPIARLTPPPKDAKEQKDATDAPVMHLSFPKLGAFRLALDAAVSRVAAKLLPGAAIELRSLGVRFADGLRIGPGVLRVHAPKEETIDVRYSSNAEQGKPSLSFHLELSLGADDRAELEGGPLPLKLLGVEEGAGGIVDVDKATLSSRGTIVLSAHGDSLTFDGEGSGRHLGIRNRRLANDPVHGLDVGFRARGMMSADKELRLDEAMVSLGALRFEARGTLVQKTDQLEAQASFAVPTAPCDVLLKSLPEGLVPNLVGTSLSGDFGLKGHIAFVSNRLDELTLDVRPDNRCKFLDVPAPLRKERFHSPFLHRIYTPEGELTEAEMGPGSASWAPIDEISPFMQVAVLTTEDGAFPHHHGVSLPAIRNALVANLKAGRFLRGASTITMQLAKNLFLVRDKTLSRKLEELVLTDYLEETFTKEEMMELYLNIVEFGPNVYGVSDAAAHYFGRRPAELNLAECMFLAKMLPRPVGNHWVYEKGVPDSWMREIQSYMRTANKLGKINEGELKLGLGETILFQKEGSPTPVKRRPVRGTHLLGDDDPDWQPTQ